MIEAIDEMFKMILSAIALWLTVIFYVIWKAGKESEPS